jgi:cardiolipin synthase
LKDRPLRGGHRLALLEGGDALFAAMVQAIDAAQREVRLETYIFATSGSPVAVLQALVRAAARGVPVYLLTDGVGTPELAMPWPQALADAGVQWRVYRPLGRWGLLIPSRWRRLHRKLCVVDGRLAFCGGINLLDDRIDPNHGPLEQPRFDFAVQVEGPAADEVWQAMAQLWWRLQAVAQARGRDLSGAWRSAQQALRARLSGAGAGLGSGAGGPGGADARAALLLRDNLTNRRSIERAYLKAIAGAQQEIIIANAYFLPGVRMQRALVLAARRGVRVRLLLQGRYEYFMQFHGTRPVMAALLSAGMEIHEYAASFLHAKVAVIDAQGAKPWATVGSSNLDPLSLLLAREANLVTDDAAFVQQLRQRLERAMVQGGRLLSLQDLQSRTLAQRLLDGLAWAVMRLSLLVMGKRY